jgi:hypothetical protein
MDWTNLTFSTTKNKSQRDAGYPEGNIMHSNDMHLATVIAVNKSGDGSPSNTVMAVL